MSLTAGDARARRSRESCGGCKEFRRLGARLPPASFDMLDDRHTHQTTHCTRTPPPIHLHSSQWQGTSALQLRWLAHGAPRRAALDCPPPALRTKHDTDNYQLGLPREPCAALPARVPEARWLEDMAKGAWSLWGRARRAAGM
jgi:hypothetical protein